MNKDRVSFIFERIFSRLERYFRAALHPSQTFSNYVDKKKLREGIVKRILSSDEEETSDITCIIFSKDRAVQLNALISSYKASISNPPEIFVTFGFSSERHFQAYQEVFERHKDVVVKVDKRKDSEFKTSFLKLLNSVTTSKVFFLVDDNIFTRDFDIKALSSYSSKVFAPSLRLHEGLEWCYNRFRSQKVPDELKESFVQQDHFSWLYGDGDGDWGYPLSLDGHIFSTLEMKILMNEIDFYSPNSLESSMQILNPLFFKRKGICQRTPVMVNVPCNKIQSENDNPYTQRYHQDELLQMWENGLEIDFFKLKDFVNNSAHDDVEFSFKKRDGFVEQNQ